MKALTRLVAADDKMNQTPTQVLNDTVYRDHSVIRNVIKNMFGDSSHHQLNPKEAKILKKAIENYGWALSQALSNFNKDTKKIR